MYYKGLFKKLWVDKKAKYFSSACYSDFQIKSDENGYMHEVKYPELTPHVIHQYDRIVPVIENIKKVCPSLGPWHRFPAGRPDEEIQDENGYKIVNNADYLPE